MLREDLVLRQLEKDATTANDRVVIGSMLNSALQLSSPGATQTINISQAAGTDAAQLVSTIFEGIEKLGLQQEERQELEAQLATINAQLQSAKPKASIIKVCFEGVKAIVQKAAVSGAATELTAFAKDVTQSISNLLAAM